MFHVTNWFIDQIQFFVTPFGGGIFILVYILWSIFLLPGSWISMLAGAIYGTLLGTLLVFIGASVGAIFTFWSARTFLRNWSQKHISNYPKFKYIDQKVSQEGLKLIFLARLSPIFPFGLLNLFFGLSQVKFRNYLIGLVAILPGTFLYCSLGSLAGDLTRFDEVLSNKNDLLSFLLSLIGFLATVLVLVLVFRSTNKGLHEFDASL